LYLFKLFGAFYPTVQFVYDEQNPTPNAYFFEENGVTPLVVTGGLAGCQPVKLEGMALIIATMVGAIAGGPPFNDQGWSCLGVASYATSAGILPNVWIGMQSVPIFKAGLEQVTELFNLIKPDHRGGSNTCMGVSTDCRITAMNAGFDMLPLPACASGAPDPALEVTGADGHVDLPHGTVTVSFNLNVDPLTASEPANYGFDPLADSFAAQVSKTDPTTVLVSVDLQEKTDYVLTVTGVLSEDKQPLVPGKNTAKFTATK
jgi:hypothetical protein